MDIRPVRALEDNLIWLLTHENHAWVVDPGDAVPVLDALEQHVLTLKGILITHHHYDHVQGVEDLLGTLGSMPVYGPAHSPFDKITHPVREGDSVQVGPWTLQVLELPGHTLDHIAYVHPQAAFVGDTLFTAGCGRLFEGRPEQMAESLLKLRALPDETLIYCGHEYTWANIHFAAITEPHNAAIALRRARTIDCYQRDELCVPEMLAVEKATNPFLRFDHPALKAQLLQRGAEDTPASLFAVLRAWKDQLDATGELEPTP